MECCKECNDFYNVYINRPKGSYCNKCGNELEKISEM